MTEIVLVGCMTGLGCLGVWHGLRPARPSLEAVVRTGGAPAPGQPVQRPAGARWVMPNGVTERILSHPRWRSLQSSLAITGRTPDQLVLRAVFGVGAGLLAPPALWAGAAAVGVSVPLLVPVLMTLLLVPTTACLPFASLLSDARSRRSHFRVVLGTYVDLVVLGLAGGVGIEGALLAAAEVSSDWATRRIARSLHRARGTGESAWEALGTLGGELGVDELLELSNSLQLAGTEGARIRQSLTARAASLRRHEQAEAESDANEVTERLFLPGALLLLGFLLFIGYPAVSRILAGF